MLWYNDVMKRINISMTEEMYEALRKIAFVEKKSMSEIVRLAIKNYTSKNDKN